MKKPKMRRTIQVYWGNDFIKGFRRDKLWCYKLYQLQLFRFGVAFSVDIHKDCKDCLNICYKETI
ncbi:MAG: hypothetical protein GY853_16135 [PVC group bacterium]|nr:hypothetical protein [PVC group bacterium]